MSLVIIGKGAYLQITQIQDFIDDSGNAILPNVQKVGGGNDNVGGGCGGGGGEDKYAHMRVIFTLIDQLDAQLRNKVSVFKYTTHNLLAKTNCALQRISHTPISARQRTTSKITNESVTKLMTQTPYEVTLSKKPKEYV